jgi:endonuclease I
VKSLPPIALLVVLAACGGGPDLVTGGDAWGEEAAGCDLPDAGLPWDVPGEPGPDAAGDAEWGEEAPGDDAEATDFEGEADVEPDAETDGAGDPPGDPGDDPATDPAGDPADDPAPDPAQDVAGDSPWPGDIVYTGIYAGLDDLWGAELAAKLCSLVKSGYDSLSYDAAGDLIREEIDNFGGKVEEIYTGTWVANGTGLNMEHTWPQSKGASSSPAKSDMFHLFASYPSFNSPRGNLAYGAVVAKDWPDEYTGNAGCTDHFPGHELGCFSFRGDDIQGVKVFEPRDAHKGNAARAIFYFSIRYGTNCALKPLKLFDESHPAVSEALYKTWNLLDPPDDDERARNDRIEKYQNVRNPFIDHPELVDRISFQ